MAKDIGGQEPFKEPMYIAVWIKFIHSQVFEHLDSGSGDVCPSSSPYEQV